MHNLNRRDLILSASIGVGAITLPAWAAPKVSAAIPPKQNWQKLATEAYRGKQDDICFVSPDIGWYGNGAGKLFGTRDGGMTWTKLIEKPGTFIRALGFIDEKRGFIGNVGTDYYPGVSDKQPLYRTEDGGASWIPVTAPGIESVAGICGIDIVPQRRVFQGTAVTSHVVHAAGRVGGPAMILRSLDSGMNWSVIDLSKQAGMILDVKFFDAQTGFVCAATNSDLGEGKALILRTSDGGKTWAQAYVSSRKQENCWKMNWPSRKVGYATVQSYDDDPANTKRVIVKTVDGGKTWKEMPLVTAAGVQEFGIGFVDEKRGWVGCRGGGYETRDGGKTWAAIEFGKAVNKIRIVRSGATTRAFAIGTEVHRIDLG
jgi:photosystem II stability/assembly factor-like uncharacterized protein